MKYGSPLRYPGGKASFAKFLSQIIQENGLRDCDYFEPFAGGAGAALTLLSEGMISRLYLNDLDPSIFTFWWVIREDPDCFAEKIMSVPVNIQEWKKQSQIFQTGNIKSFELGFATFYLNRCNRSGILRGAGPIGGFSQAGKWKLDARFNKKSLAERVQSIARYRDRIEIENLSAVDFLKRQWQNNNALRKSFAYLDPPYFINGNRLYYNGLREYQDHVQLADYVQEKSSLSWAISYDNGEHISRFFQEHRCNTTSISLRYSLQVGRTGQEVLITPHHLRIPKTALIGRHRHEHIHDGERK